MPTATAAKKPCTSAADIISQASHLAKKRNEHVLAFLLNKQNGIIAIEHVSEGTTTASLAHPREIFRRALLKNAESIILVHNHPSGDPSPSEEDVRLTKRIRQAGQIIGIELIDHLIIADNGCYSFKTAGLI